MRDLESKIGYRFNDGQLLSQALRHASSLSRDPAAMSYQRLEFLGDSVLNLCVAEELYALFPGADEGALTKARAAVINNRNLCSVGRRIGIPSAVRIDRSVGAGVTPKMIADTVEAIAGAIFLDGGFESARTFVRGQLLSVPGIAEAAARFDAKSRLQEHCQQARLPLPEYHLVSQDGPAHARSYRVSVSACGLSFEGSGATKKEAGMDAAAKLLESLPRGGGKG